MFDSLFLRGFSIGNNFDEEYLNHIPALRHLHSFDFEKPVTFFIGENGTGKSTLLEALAIQCGFNPEGGTRNFNFSTKESHSGLYRSLKISRGIPFAKDGFFLRAESFYNVATEIEKLEIDGKPGFMERNYGGDLHEKSHGESFLALALNRFKGNSLFILDEPESALSPSRQMSLLARIHELVKDGSQFIIATHSPILMAYPDADIIAFTDDGAERTSYKQTEHFVLTRQFLNNPHNMLRYLLED